MPARRTLSAATRTAPAMPTPLPLQISDEVVALPCIGGVLADLPLGCADSARFSEAERLPVSQAAAKAYRESPTALWVAVIYQGGGVVMTPAEASARGLPEAIGWPVRSPFSITETSS